MGYFEVVLGLHEGYIGVKCMEAINPLENPYNPYSFHSIFHYPNIPPYITLCYPVWRLQGLEGGLEGLGVYGFCSQF